MGAIDASELGRLFESEASALVLYARQWLDVAMAEDAVQDAFVTLMAQGQQPAQPKAWLYRTVRNRALKIVRSRDRQEQREQRAALETPAWFEPHPGDLLDAQTAEAALRQLPAPEREIVTLRIWGGLTLEAVAGVMGCSVAAAFRQYRAALNRIRTELSKPCHTKTI
jgi:RNA polymerase sigma-70 factor (ECF subfamily)